MEASKEEQIPGFVARVIDSLDKSDSIESAMKGLGFRPGPTDIILSTAVKTGTTVVQQVRSLCCGM